MVHRVEYKEWNIKSGTEIDDLVKPPYTQPKLVKKLEN